MSRLFAAVTVIRSTLASFSFVTGGIALLTLVGSYMTFVFLPELGTTIRVLLAIAVFLLVLFVIGAYSEVRAGVVARQTRYGTNTGLMAAALIGIAIVVNVISANNHQRVDVTAGGQYTLARQTITVLKNLEQPVKVTGFFTADPFSQAVQEQAKNLLAEYRFQSDKVSSQFFDPEEKPGIARQYEVRQDGAMVFESDGQRKMIFGIGEQEFTGAILNVTGTEQLNVYFVVGHGERDINSGESRGYGFVRDGLVADNYQVRSINLASVDKMPDDVALLVLAGPEKPFLASEIQLIDQYLENGGKALILVDPNPLPEATDLLTKWGVVLKDGVVVDEMAFVTPDVTVPVAQGNQYFFGEITDNVAASFFPGAAGLARSIPEDDQDHVFVNALALTTLQSFLETDKESIGFDEAADEPGPFPLALIVRANKPIGRRPVTLPTGAGSNGASAPEPETTRLVVFADSDFATNEFFYSLGNSDLFLNSVNWLTAQEELISIRPKPPQFRRMVITQRAWNFILYSTVAFWPLAVLVAGAYAWWRRR